jgi:hypothetical protein
MKYRKGKKARKIKYSDENLAVNIPGGHIQDRRSGMRNLAPRTTAAMERINAQKYNLITEQVHILQERQLDEVCNASQAGLLLVRGERHKGGIITVRRLFDPGRASDQRV